MHRVLSHAITLATRTVIYASIETGWRNRTASSNVEFAIYMSLQLSSAHGLCSANALYQQRSARTRIGVRTAPQKTSIVCSDSSGERLYCSETVSKCSR